MKYLLAIALLTLSKFSIGQYQPLQATFTYQIDIQTHPDSTFIPYSTLTMATNDTLVRIDSKSFQLGKQQHITHLQLHKSYLLLDYKDTKYAIQTNDKADTSASKYTFTYKNKSKKILGLKAKKAIVSSEYFPKPINVWYLPNYSPNYLSVLKGIKGLPVDYFLTSQEGILHYSLVKIDFNAPSKDLFGVPSDYKRISFDAFISEIGQ